MKEGCNQPMMTGFAETTLGELPNKHVDTIAQMDKHGGILLSQPWGWNQTILSYYVANWPKNLLGGNPRMSMNIQVSAPLLHQIIPSLATHGTDLTVGHWPPLITPSPCKAHTLRAGRSSCLEWAVLWVKVHELPMNTGSWAPRLVSCVTFCDSGDFQWLVCDKSWWKNRYLDLHQFHPF